MGIACYEYFLKPQPFTATVLVSVLLSVVLVLLFVISGQLVGAPVKDKEPPLSEAERMTKFSKSYHLTPKESEVLEKLLTTEDGVQKIADSFFISRGVLERHISSIYQKTGTKSRIGLYQLYYTSSSEDRP